MPTIRVSIDLPYRLILPSGEYPTPGVGGTVHLAEGTIARSGDPVGDRTEASSLFDAPGADDAEAQERRRQSEADALLRRVNRKLRWYRVATGQAAITELTRAQVSPFLFTAEETGAAWGGVALLEYEAATFPLPIAKARAAYGEVVSNGLGGNTDPDVAALNLLDAEYALSVGRFRESVLLCWGAIDSTFVRKFKNLVDDRLADEWAEGRDLLLGINFGLRHKMTTGLRLLVGRSLYSEPDGFWQDLSTSYKMRNRIIHEGAFAQEDDAKLAINVARRIVRIAASL